MRLTAAQLIELVDGKLNEGVGHGAYRQRNEQLIGVKSGVVITQMLYLEVLNRLDNSGSDEQQLFINACKVLECIHKTSRACTEQGAGLAGDDSAVRQLNGDGGTAGLLGFFECLCDNGPVVGGKTHRVHDKLDSADLLGSAEALTQRAGGGIAAADDLLP